MVVVHQGQTIHSALQYTENQLTQTNTCIGNSNHFITAKHSVYNTLAHRAKVVSSDPQSLHQDWNTSAWHFRTFIFQNGHSTSYNKISNADNITTMKPTLQTNKTSTPPTAMEPTSTTTTTTTTTTSTWWFPYIQGLGGK